MSRPHPRVPRLLELIADTVNSAESPAAVFCAIIRYLASNVLIPDDVKASVLHSIAREWDSIRIESPRT